MTFILGLTGSIGMGKSTAAKIFTSLDVPVWDADGTVHLLYAPGGAAVSPVAAICPDALVDGGIDRNALKAWLAEDPDRYATLEAIVHPLVAQERQAFLSRHREADERLVVLDIPLLFESKSPHHCDAVLLVTTSAEEQRRRVMSRPGMTEALFQQILSRQMPDSEKRKRADFVIVTETLDQTTREIETLVRTLTTADRRPA